MNTQKESGYFVLADISGFTAYLVDAEIEHAQAIIQDLLELIVRHLSKTLIFVQTDGDAVFTYIHGTTIERGETLFELIESTYIGFKNRVAEISQNRECSCKACREVGTLDLKFAVHYGDFALQEFQNHLVLMGLAPLFILKRKWKEAVAASTDWRGYALFTEDSLKQLNLHPDDLEAVEIKGSKVRTFGLNLQSRYALLYEHHQVIVDSESAQAVFTKDYSVSPSTLWAWINEPEKRSQWYSLRWIALVRTGGRTGRGAVNHCRHGLGETIETIVDWRPFDYFTSEYRIMPGKLLIQQTKRLEALPDGGTRLHVQLRTANSSPSGWARFFCKMFAWYEKFSLQRLQKLVDSYPMKNG